MKDVRGARKAERRYGDEAKRCVACGRWHTRRDTTCSSACEQKGAQISDFGAPLATPLALSRAARRPLQFGDFFMRLSDKNRTTVLIYIL